MPRLTRYLGFNVPEWMWIAFFAYVAFLTGSLDQWRSPSPGLGGLFRTVIVPLFFTGLLGFGPVLVLRAGVRLVDRLSGESDEAEEQ
jgi:hypothetical protein